MHNQPFSNGLASPSMGNMQYMRQQSIMRDAFPAMTPPMHPADENLICHALIQAERHNHTYKEALNGLHGVSKSLVLGFRA
jgi:hypothetical protein